MDDDSYANYDKSKRDLVRLKLVNEGTEKTNMLANDLGLAEVYSSLDLDRADFSSAPGDGVAYFLNTDWFEYCLQEAPSMSSFADKIADQDVVVAKFSMQGNLICRKLIAQGVVTGCASA